MRLLLACFLLILATSVAAQEGSVRYEITTQLDIDLPPGLAHMADQIPSSRTEDRVLHFRDAVSLLVPAPKEEEDADFESGGMRIMFRQNDDDALHLDRGAGTRIERRDFLSRTFLIEGEPTAFDWRLTGEAAEFLGYTAYQATTMRDTVAVQAWFTPEIPASVGPGPYGGLPGLILVVTEDGARRTFIARDVSLGSLEEGLLDPPDSGRRVTQDEFDAIVEEKMEDMRGRGGAMIIRG
ncbi:MAG: GLPGLI family protein [Bacteroidota bacterium]